jgi:hypothetical protein
MKKTNENSCVITRIWPTLDDMKKDLFIDLDKQEVTNLLTMKKLKNFLSQCKRKKEKNYYKVAFSKNKKKYNFLLHRLFFYWHHGYLPKLVDHKDINSQNNKIENLRELTISQNKRNSPKMGNCTSIYKGVNWSKKHKKWLTKLTLNGKAIHIGLFDNEDDAGQAYNDAIRRYGLEEVSVMNDTPQERARKNIQFDSLPQEMNHIKDLFKNLDLLDFGNLK